MIVALEIVGAIGALMLFAQFGLRLIYWYRLTDDSIDVVLFGIIPIMRMHLSDIISIKKHTMSELTPLAFVFRFGNRFFGDSVLIERERVIFRRVVITPDDADTFIVGVQRQLAARRT